MIQTGHVQEKENLWQPAVVSCGALNSRKTLTNMTYSRAFQSHCLKPIVPNECAELSNSSLYHAPLKTIARQCLAYPLNSMRIPNVFTKLFLCSASRITQKHYATELNVLSELHALSHFVNARSTLGMCFPLHTPPESITRPSSACTLN
jgi:hypothetical protein